MYKWQREGFTSYRQYLNARYAARGFSSFAQYSKLVREYKQERGIPSRTPQPIREETTIRRVLRQREPSRRKIRYVGGLDEFGDDDGGGAAQHKLVALGGGPFIKSQLSNLEGLAAMKHNTTRARIRARFRKRLQAARAAEWDTTNGGAFDTFMHWIGYGSAQEWVDQSLSLGITG